MFIKIPKYETNEKEVIQIDPWDTWSLDHTLAPIIHKCLVQLKETTHGAPFTDDEDVPEGLRSTSAPPKENEWDTDEYWFSRWDYILDEMIWTFGNYNNDENYDQSKEVLDRISNGLRLFGKYYRNLWD